MKKTILTATAISFGLLFSGCSTKTVDPVKDGYDSVQLYKKGNSYILKPIQYVKGVSINGAYVVEGNQPIIIDSNNCKFVVAATKETDINVQMKIESISCEIDEEIFASSSVEGWIMQGDYNGMKLEETKVKKGDSESSYYGIKPGQNVKVFLKEGSLEKIN